MRSISPAVSSARFSALRLSAVSSAILMSSFVVGSLATSAQAAVAWDAPAGATSTFSWTNGSSANGFYGSPLITDTGMFFTPGLFSSIQTNGGMTTISDFLTVDLAITQPESGPRKQFTSFRVTQFGDFQLIGTASANIVGGLEITTVESLPAQPDYVPAANGSIFNNNNVSNYRHYTGTTSAPVDPQPFAAAIDSGSIMRLWDGSLEVILPSGVTKVRFQLTNSMTTTASNGGAATMQMKAIQNPFTIEVFAADIPEPASMMVLGAAGMLILKRRRA